MPMINFKKNKLTLALIAVLASLRMISSYIGYSNYQQLQKEKAKNAAIEIQQDIEARSINPDGNCTGWRIVAFTSLGTVIGGSVLGTIIKLARILR